MLAEQIDCKCGEKAIKRLVRNIFRRSGQAGSMQDDQIIDKQEFEISCPKCGTKTVTEDVE
jgi:Zn finger protein HypA/HybF involved in hydrogenase expression